MAAVRQREGFGAGWYAIFAAVTLSAALICVCLGSVRVPIGDTVQIVWRAICGEEQSNTYSAIILRVRIPRVICTALIGAMLSVSGAAMQGLLKNPLADGSTLGVSSGASLGAVAALAFGIVVPGVSFAGVTALSMISAFLSLIVILALAYKLDYSLATNTIILIGVIFSMFVSSIISLVVTFAGDRVRQIMFWTMGSLSGKGYTEVLVLAGAFVALGAVILLHARELNAFAVGEENARGVGVNVRRVKLIIMVSVSAMIGICVSVSGTIGFVGLVTPHMTRMFTGPNHRKLLPASMFAGAVFLLLADLVSRTVLSPLELPAGVVTSFIGSIVFVLIFWRTRRGG